MLAETVSIDPGILILFLVIAFVILAVSVAVVIGGFVLAPKAGRGSSRAKTWWIVCLGLEALSIPGSVVALLSGEFNPGIVVMPAIIAGQVALYRRADREPR